MYHLGGIAAGAAHGEHPHLRRFQICSDRKITAQRRSLYVQDAIFNGIGALREVDSVLRNYGVTAIFQGNGDLQSIGRKGQGMGLLGEHPALIYIDQSGDGDIRNAAFFQRPGYRYPVAHIPGRQIQLAGRRIIFRIHSHIHAAVQQDSEVFCVGGNLTGEVVCGDLHAVPIHHAEGIIRMAGGNCEIAGGCNLQPATILIHHLHERLIHHGGQYRLDMQAGRCRQGFLCGERFRRFRDFFHRQEFLRFVYIRGQFFLLLRGSGRFLRFVLRIRGFRFYGCFLSAFRVRRRRGCRCRLRVRRRPRRGGRFHRRAFRILRDAAVRILLRFLRRRFSCRCQCRHGQHGEA